MPNISDPVGTWHLTLKTRISNASPGVTKRITVTISQAASAGAFFGTCDSDRSLLIDNIEWDSTNHILTFRKHPVGRGKQKVGEWFRGDIVEGVFVGRFTDENQPISPDSPPADLTKFVNHVTGWNTVSIDRGAITPRVFAVTFGDREAILRIDSTPDWKDEISPFVGTLKSCKPEALEFDLRGISWDGAKLVFRMEDSSGTWDFDGWVSDVSIAGKYVSTKSHGKPGKPKKWKGKRSQVLSFGVASKSEEARGDWQAQTRARLQHLMMASNPSPAAAFTALVEVIPAFPDAHIPCQRDDDWKETPQHYSLSEYYALNLIPDPYGGVPIVRRGHGWLAVPDPPPPPGTKCPAVLAMNGHHGSAHRVMDPNGGHGSAHYWYGDSFARRFFRPADDNLPYIVLAVDTSHRNDAPYNPGYGGGDDPSHDNGPHPSVRSCGYKTSDWEETGERVWDVMRALDWLAARPDVDTSRILVTGLSMGSEVSMVTAALDPRVRMAVIAGAPSDYCVARYVALSRNGDVPSPHPCWEWINADLLEYIDASDFLALIAPRPLIVETGRDDHTYSGFQPPFAGDKQAARRTRAAYGSEKSRFIHYLHTRGHQYNVGGHDRCHDSKSQIGVQIPVVVAPLVLADWTWQTDATTDTVPQISNVASNSPTIFEYIDELLK